MQPKAELKVRTFLFLHSIRDVELRIGGWDCVDFSLFQVRPWVYIFLYLSICLTLSEVRFWDVILKWVFEFSPRLGARLRCRTATQHSK